MPQLRAKLARFEKAVAEKRPVSKPIYDNTQKKLEQLRSKYDKSINEYAKSLRKNASEDPEEALESGILFVPKNKVLPGFLTDKFDSYPVTKFLFGDYAKPLGDLLRKKGRQSISHITPQMAYMTLNKIDLPFCRPIWIHNVGYGLNISSQINLSEHNEVFGLSLKETDDIEELAESTDGVEDDEELEELEIPPDDSQIFGTKSPTQLVGDGLDFLEKTPGKGKIQDNEWVD
ncbi:hypothetical protein J4219_05785 [Candidatus Woesearchaeota archaeon]|nr:hypothetical protein [Candidatus Woesearchaeota archaeon]